MREQIAYETRACEVHTCVELLIGRWAGLTLCLELLPGRKDSLATVSLLNNVRVDTRPLLQLMVPPRYAEQALWLR